METGARVRNKKTGEYGHIVADDFGLCDHTEKMVVFDDESIGVSIDKGLLEIVLGPKPVPDFKKCGAGQEAECCIFITAGSEGAACERFTGMRNTLIFKTMSARRNPSEPYPECMKFD